MITKTITSDYQYYCEQIGEYGVVKKVQHPIVVVSGIPHAHPNEIVVFETGQQGEIFSINKDDVEILVFAKQPVKTGIKLARTGKYFSVPVGRELLGSIINPLGESLSKNKNKIITNKRDIETNVQGINERAKIKNSFYTGVTIVDMMIPLGKGQKELIIGDRKTGKTSFLLTTVKTQVKLGSLVVYAAVGRKKSDIKKLKEFFEKEKITDKIVVVASSSHDSPSLIYLTPYAAVTMAEYFRDQGENVLLILDDLSTHARFYREIALLSRRFPGRDSYPGDIFYTHAKLMERAGNFKHQEKGTVSITCLPVVETIEGDLTGYISTNIMGMTDGHIFFDSNAFYRGRRPAINISLSVTRVGRQTQSALGREINRKLTAFLATYEKMQTFSHFGAELSEKIKGILKTGDKIYKFFDQYYSLIIPAEVQLIIFALIWSKIFDQEPDEKIEYFQKKLVDVWHADENARKFYQGIVNVKTLYDLLTNVTNNKDKILAL